MAGLLAYAAAGAVQGYGESMVERARLLAQESAAALERSDRKAEREAERNQDRAWQIEDREWEMGQVDAERQRLASAVDAALQPGEPGYEEQQRTIADLPAGSAPAGYSLPKGEMANRWVSGLVERGLPQHVAEGFVLNGMDESGLDPSINEANPLVAGSRGGGGTMQWTGARRKGLEKYAAENGSEWYDPETQMDFLMLELQGDENKAYRKIMSTRNRGEAAAVIAESYLRPAKEHLDRRRAKYLQDDGAALQGLIGAGASQGTIDQVMRARGGAGEGFRPATQEELDQYGADAGQIDEETGRFYSISGREIDDDDPNYRILTADEKRGMGISGPGVYQQNRKTGQVSAIDGTTTSAADEEDLDAEITEAIRAIGLSASSVPPEVLLEIKQRVRDGEAIEDVLAEIERGDEITNEAGTWLGRITGQVPADAPPDEVSKGTGPVTGLRGGQPATGESPAAPRNPGTIAPPAAAVKLLAGDPSEEAMREFDEVFGPGAAARALGMQ